MASPNPNRALPPMPVPAKVFTAVGSVISVYVSTTGALPDAAEQVVVRWKNVRRSLVDGGAPAGALAAVEPLIDGAHEAGETLVAIAHERGLLHTAHLPELAVGDIATVGPLAHLVPFLEAAQRMLPHLVVVTDRIGAEIVAVRPAAPDEHREVTGDGMHVTRSAPGGWSQRRYQQRAENRWEANARAVADEVVRLADATDPRLIVVSGDVRAVAFLREHLPDHVTSRLAEVQGEYSSVDEALRRSQQLVADLASEDTATTLAAFGSGSDHPGNTVVGAAETLDALARGQVDTVLLDPDRTAGETAWFGPELAEVAASAEQLQAAGVAEPMSAPLADVLVRGAGATAAAVRIAGGAEQLAPTGVGGLLRY